MRMVASGLTPDAWVSVFDADGECVPPGFEVVGFDPQPGQPLGEKERLRDEFRAMSVPEGDPALGW